MIMGDWYPVNGNPGIYISLIMAKGIAPEILRSYPNVVSGLDKEEAEALAYIVAFDLDQFDFKYALGTDHPRVEWSDHILDRMKDNSLPGPDGIGNIAPLVSTGLINPKDRDRTVATFTGGFKRAHGAFRWGNLALKNHGSHYGFIENGVVFSRLQPGLSTIYMLDDGQLDMKTWAERRQSTPFQNQIRPAEWGPHPNRGKRNDPDVRSRFPCFPVGRRKLGRLGRQKAADHASGGRPARG